MKLNKVIAAASKFMAAQSGLLSLWIAGFLMPTQAQVIPDGSLGTQNNSGVISGGRTTGDSASGQNLFHSFQQFSLSPADTVTFVTTPSVENIISRVTGNIASEIHGTLEISGSGANLFLLNPAGIVFGPTAQLNLPGSFVATTAEQAIFSNGEVFSAESMSAPSLLTVSAPIGLNMGDSSSAITVNNTGHNLTKINPSTRETGILAPHVQIGTSRGLQVNPGKTLGLFGQGVRLEGGLLAAHSGNVEVGSVAAGNQIGLVETPFGFATDYAQVEAFAAVDLVNRSLINVSGLPMALRPNSPLQLFVSDQGRAQVVGEDINLLDNSVLLGQSGSFATGPGQAISVSANGTLSLIGSEAETTVRSGIFSETLGAMPSGNIHVSADNLQIKEGAGITGFTFTDASSGSINVEIAETLQIEGVNAIDQGLSSTIATASIGATGTSGNITATATDTTLSAGGGIVSINFAQGRSGNLQVNADTLTLSGRNRASDVPSTISVTNYGVGEVGNVEINTRLLSISDTAAIAALSITDGDAGSIEINAAERLDISGPSATTRRGDAITSSVITPSLAEQAFLGIPFSRPGGNAGNVTIRTPALSIDGAFGINVQSVGAGNAGNALIVADSVRLANSGEIRGRTFNGEGGNIELQLKDSLVMRNGSRLTVESDGTGNGGNISISAPAIVAVGNSDIVANAVQGDGGNIDITTQSILGTAFRDRLTPQSDITASSQFGLNGTVKISTPEVDPSSGTAALSDTLLDQDQQIAAGCADTQGNQFVASGRGGLSVNPSETLQSLQPWQDTRPLLARTVAASHTPIVRAASIAAEEAIAEAVAWQRNENGQVTLMALPDVSSPSWQTAQCLSQEPT